MAIRIDVSATESFEILYTSLECTVSKLEIVVQQAWVEYDRSVNEDALAFEEARKKVGEKTRLFKAAERDLATLARIWDKWQYDLRGCSAERAEIALAGVKHAN